MSDAPPIASALRRRIENDPWAKALGVEFLEVRRGHCRLRLQLQSHMLNFQGYPHGGVIFSLADVAFGAACNSHGEESVALTVTINYLAAAAPDWWPRRASSSRGGRRGFTSSASRRWTAAPWPSRRRSPTV